VRPVIGIKCYMLERTDQFQKELRRFTFSTDVTCSARRLGHDATVKLDIIEFETNLEGTIFECARADERWPSKCDSCDYLFTEDDQWQSNSHRLYREPSGQLVQPRDADVGAMYFIPWYDEFYKPQLEHVLAVVLPGRHIWVVDSQANNCTIPDDRRQERHHCWVIEGTLPNITAGKSGPTCSAGAGSIAIPGWHGVLRNGYLEGC
jgi:hypothetical protein